MPEHKTARHQDFGDGDVAFRMDREYYWDCSCGIRSGNNSSRTKMDSDRLAHEAEANPSEVEKAQELAHKVLPEVIGNVIGRHLDELAVKHRNDPLLLDWDGNPSYQAEAKLIVAEINALAEAKHD
jgi:hypothetical protein